MSQSFCCLGPEGRREQITNDLCKERPRERVEDEGRLVEVYCGDCGLFITKKYIEILEFTRFTKFWTFNQVVSGSNPLSFISMGTKDIATIAAQIINFHINRLMKFG